MKSSNWFNCNIQFGLFFKQKSALNLVLKKYCLVPFIVKVSINFISALEKEQNSQPNSKWKSQELIILHSQLLRDKLPEAKYENVFNHFLKVISKLFCLSKPIYLFIYLQQSIIIIIIIKKPANKNNKLFKKPIEWDNKANWRTSIYQLWCPKNQISFIRPHTCITFPRESEGEMTL